MPRKKVVAPAANAASISYLDENEELVEENTNTRRIRRERRPEPAAAADIITVEPDEDEDEDTINEPPYSDTSLANVIFGEGEQDFSNQFCSIHVRRNPDSMNDRFAVPCSTVTNLPRLANVEISADKADIEERVRSEYGGGHYFFQIHFDGRLRSSWKATLSDLPAGMAKVRTGEIVTAAEPQPAPAAALPAADPMDMFLTSLKKTAELRSLLFGETEKQLKEEIERLRTAAANVPPPPPAAPQSETLLLVEKALSSNNTALQDRLLEAAFPSEEKGSKHWLAETLSVVIENKDAIAGVLGSLLSSAAPAPPPNQFADMMRMQPPPAPARAIEPPPQIFKRGTRPPADVPPQPAETPAEPSPASLGSSAAVPVTPAEDEAFDAIEAAAPPAKAKGAKTK